MTDATVERLTSRMMSTLQMIQDKVFFFFFFCFFLVRWWGMVCCLPCSAQPARTDKGARVPAG